MSTTSNAKAEVHIYKHIHTQNHGTMVSHTHTHTHTQNMMILQQSNSKAWDIGIYFIKNSKKHSYEEKQWATRKGFSINSRVKLVKIVSSLPIKLKFYTHTHIKLNKKKVTLKNSMNEMKNAIENISDRADQMEERINDLEIGIYK